MVTTRVVPMTLYGITPDALMGDVYHRHDFLELHRASGYIDHIDGPTFRNGAVVRPIEGTEFEDMETPWGYGGPIATDHDAMRQGMWLWRQRQREAGRVAEFVRLHPFLNPLAVRDYYADIKFDRVTIAVDLTQSQAIRRRAYSEGTKHRLRRAAKNVSVVKLGAEHADSFQRCYVAGLDRNNALSGYYPHESYYERLLSMPWVTCFGADDGGEIVSVACFLHGQALCHYHLSGSTPVGREKLAHYILLEHAFDHFAERGQQVMHLGGGRTSRADDPLLEFKKKFSKWRIAFYTAGAIYDPEVYSQLSTGDTRRFLNYRFSLSPRDDVGDVTLRPASADDFLSYFQLKCDVSNIFWSGHDSPPEWRHLSEWYAGHIRPESRREIFIAEMNGQIVGYGYLDDKDDHLESTIGVAASQSSRSVGRRILVRLLDILRARSETRPVEAWIFPENVASVRAHEAAGFRLHTDRPPRTWSMPFIENGHFQNCWIWTPTK